MKKTCRYCQNATALPVKITDLSLKAQAAIADAKKAVYGQGKAARLEAVEKVVTSAAYAELIKIHGALSLSKKATDEDGGYMSCANADHLVDAKATKEAVVHKYYYSCPHFKVVE